MLHLRPTLQIKCYVFYLKLELFERKKRKCKEIIAPSPRAQEKSY